MKPKTVGELCEMVVSKGECLESEKVTIKGKEYFTCISGCKKLDGFIKKYWESGKENK